MYTEEPLYDDDSIKRIDELTKKSASQVETLFEVIQALSTEVDLLRVRLDALT